MAGKTLLERDATSCLGYTTFFDPALSLFSLGPKNFPEPCYSVGKAVGEGESPIRQSLCLAITNACAGALK